MSKKARIILLLLVIFIALAIYLTLTLKEVTVKTKTPLSSEEFALQVQEKQKKMEDTYKHELRKIFVDYDVLISENPTELGARITKLADRVFALSTPAQYKELHKSLYFVFSEVERTKPESINEIVSRITTLTSEARATYTWLNE